MDESILYTHNTKYPKLCFIIYIFILTTTIKFSVSQPSSDCDLYLQIIPPPNSSTCEWGEWGGFLDNRCCGGAFNDYLNVLGWRANQTGKIFLNDTEQTDCLTKVIVGCGIEKLTSGSGGCSDFSVDDVTHKLGDKLRNLRENCQFLSPDEENQSCRDCVRSWKDIKGTHSDQNGQPAETESDLCRFAVLVSLTSSQIEDRTWDGKIYKCLGKQDNYTENATVNIAENRTGNNKNNSDKIGIIAGVVGASAIIIFFTLVMLKKKWYKSNVAPRKNASKCVLPDKSGNLKLSVREVYAATNNLSESNFIGEGTVGKVYKGILSNKKPVAVKHIFNDKHVQTFLREVSSLSCIRHPNLVALLGCCENEDEFFLVHELCPNGNLAEWLFGKDKVLTWIQRLEIAIDSARGLWFLHTYPKGCIVHRDIKPTNILLGTNFEAKLSDFGLSKVIDPGESYASSEVRGTFGYVDPEYQSNSKVNSSGDVYSFGIVLLQIISGKKVINMNLNRPISLDKMAKSLIRGGSIVEFVDPKLNAEYSSEAFDMTFKLAVSCTSLKQKRPSMEQVVQTLEEALNMSTRETGSTPYATPDHPSTP
ncbi:probable receptor-like protein kinase At5g18500 isoform X1 [Camellia sinensis]|uniref:probable receptor-like protein kinase At5g18500 isoform X1 n=1 Tax=Camellia sinensis TaxID=4442 RepID=UPI0010364FD7|nr:probable receptor-like protein kinase At5g18500 isoform X1 [Camellia sinensis]